MKSLLMGAATLALVAGTATAQDRLCFDAACKVQSIHGLEGLASASTAVDLKSPKFGTWGFDASGMNTSVKAGDNFFQYANGTYLAKTEIPADRVRFGAFDALAILSENRGKALIEEFAAAKDLKAGTDKAKISAAFNSFMDEARIEKLGFKPIKPELAKIAAAKSRADIIRTMKSGQFGGGVFGLYVGDDEKQPTIQALNLGQGGLGLPDRDYYLEAGKAKERDAYVAHIERQLKAVGYKDPKGYAQKILAFETELAKVHWSRVQNRDPVATYNKMSLAELKTLAPAFDWDLWLKTNDINSVDYVVVAQKSAFADIANVFAKTDLETLKAWQSYSVVDEASPYLSKAFVDANWEFHAKTLSGAKEQRPRWKRGVGAVNAWLGEALGREYVRLYFPPDSKAKMIELVNNLKAGLKGRIEKLDWMSAETKAQALYKLDHFGVKIGYPDKWKDYASLDIQAGDLVGNVRRSGAFSWKESLNKLGKKTDPLEWLMTPQTVNAYYMPTRNEIVFPAAILQAPFFDPSADPAVNFGGIGGVIGHEITHGFDDQGAQYAADGSLKNWWKPEDEAKFKSKQEAFGAQYDSYEPLPGEHVQGKLTMGENIADLGGILMAQDAYKLSLKGAPAPVIDGFTGEQRVFLGWAQVWRAKARDKALSQQMKTDPHSPAEFRVIGPMRNIDSWYTAFGVTDGKYYVKPEDRVRIW